MRKFRRKVFDLLFLGALCRCAAVSFFIAGVVTAVLRIFRGSEVPFCAAVTAGLVLAAFPAAFVLARRRLPSQESFLAFLASRTPGGAVVLSARECGNAQWPLPPVPREPSVRIARFGRKAAFLLAGACFCAGTLFFPAPAGEEPEKTPGTLDLKDEAEKIAAQAELLQKELPGRKDKAAAISNELEEILRQAESTAPGRSYEMLRELQKRLRGEMVSGIREQARTLRRMEALEQLARNLSGKGKPGSAAAKEQFSQLVKALSAKDPRLAESLKNGKFDGSGLNRESLEKLADALKTDREKLKRQLENLCNKCGQQAPGASGDPAAAKEELEQFLKENVPGCDDLLESLTNREGEEGGSGGGPGGESAGSGGVSRGRGDAVLELSGKTEDYGAKRIDRALPGKGDEKGAENSRRIGRFAVDTEQKEEASGPQAGGNLSTRAAGAGSKQSTVHPAHRKAVKRYFDTGDNRP
ncbi:MAG: hypothetical protein IJT50_10110 [Lentisphaeria bacterium]|nr:hypothetical protein [Lentisphaeria bacterium]